MMKVDIARKGRFSFAGGPRGTKRGLRRKTLNELNQQFPAA